MYKFYKTKPLAQKISKFCIKIHIIMWPYIPIPATLLDTVVARRDGLLHALHARVLPAPEHVDARGAEHDHDDAQTDSDQLHLLFAAKSTPYQGNYSLGSNLIRHKCKHCSGNGISRTYITDIFRSVTSWQDNYTSSIIGNRLNQITIQHFIVVDNKYVCLLRF